MIRRFPSEVLRKQLDEINRQIRRGEYVCGLGLLTKQMFEAELIRRQNERKGGQEVEAKNAADGDCDNDTNVHVEGERGAGGV